MLFSERSRTPASDAQTDRSFADGLIDGFSSSGMGREFFQYRVHTKTDPDHLRHFSKSYESRLV